MLASQHFCGSLGALVSFRDGLELVLWHVKGWHDFRFGADNIVVCFSRGVNFGA